MEVISTNRFTGEIFARELGYELSGHFELSGYLRDLNDQNDAFWAKMTQFEYK